MNAARLERWFGRHLASTYSVGADSFGASIALSNDYAVIGSMLEDNAAGGINPSVEDDAATDSGAIYVVGGLGLARMYGRA